MVLSEPSHGSRLRFEYVPRPGLVGLALSNFLLNLITLGFYRFWAKTRVRRHIWSCVHINGEPLEYTGRGIELLKGALIVFAVLVVPFIAAIAAVQIVYGQGHAAVVIVQLLFFLVVFVLWGMAVYRARRYQLSRTLWRGIRGGLVGSSWSYTWLNAGAQLLRGITADWSTPAMNLNLQQRMIGDMRFGETPFRFKGQAGPLYPTYAVCWVLVVALAGTAIGFAYEIGSWFDGSIAQFLQQLDEAERHGRPPSASQMLLAVASVLLFYAALGFIYTLAWAIYSAREMSVFANYTSIDQASFRLAATAGSLIALALGNLLILVLTLGAGSPFVQQRNVRYLVDRVSAVGTVDLGRIMQSRQKVASYGEGLADAFDVGGL